MVQENLKIHVNMINLSSRPALRQTHLEQLLLYPTHNLLRSLTKYLVFHSGQNLIYSHTLSETQMNTNFHIVNTVRHQPCHPSGKLLVDACRRISQIDTLVLELLDNCTDCRLL